MARRAELRAIKRLTEFTIVPEDLLPLPRYCPVFRDIPLIYEGKKGTKEQSASLDRIDNAEGYTPENTHIISARANSIKADATLSELRDILRYMETHNAIPW